MTKTQKMQGVLTQWGRGFGRITGQDGKRYFLFHSSIKTPERLRIGDIVEFVPAPAADARYGLVDALAARRTVKRVETAVISGGTGFRREKVTTEALNKFMGE